MAAFHPANPKRRYQLTWEGAWPTSVAFLAGCRLAAGNQLGQVFVWDLPEAPPTEPTPDGKERPAANIWPTCRLDGHTNEITRLLATPDGKYLVSASRDHTVRVWPTEAPATGKAETVLDADSRERLARQSGQKKAPPAPGVVVETQTACDVLEGHKEWVYALGMSGDGRQLISGDAAGQVIVWDLAGRRPISRWSGHPWNWIVAVALSPDGKTALVSENRYKRDDFDIPTPALKLWNTADGTEKLDLLKVQFPKLNATERSYGAAQVWRKFVANGLITVAYAPNGRLLAVGQGGETDTGKVHLLDATTGQLLRDVSGHQYGVTDVLFTKDAQYLLSAGRDTCVRVIQVADGKEVAVLGTPRGGQFKDWISAIALSPDERLLAAADIAGQIHVWEFAE